MRGVAAILDTPDSVHVPLWVVVERRPGVTRWAEEVWRAVDAVESAPEGLPGWVPLREEPGGRALYLAGPVEVALHPSDTRNLKDNLEAAEPRVWVVLRPAPDEPPAGLRLFAATADGMEAHLYGEVGGDLLEALPMPPGLRAVVADFVARHHRERAVHKRRREEADPEALAARRPRPGATYEGEPS